MRQLIFWVGDEVGFRKAATQGLRQAGYDVRQFSASDPNFMAEAEGSRPSLVLICMKERPGNELELCRRVRESGLLDAAYILFLLRTTALEHRALALESGADDCIVTPSGPQDLVASLEALTGRLNQRATPSPVRPADIVIDSSAMTVWVRGTEIATTGLEFRLIEYLARYRGKVFTRDLLLDAVWGEMQFVTPRSVDACIRRIREKIEPDRSCPTYLKTIRGVGYRLDAVAAWHTVSNGGCACAVCRPPRSDAFARRNRTPENAWGSVSIGRPSTSRLR